MFMKKIVLLLSLCAALLSFGNPTDLSATVLSPYLGYHYMDNTRDLNNAWELGADFTQKIGDQLYLDYNLGLVPSSVKSSGEGKWLLAGGVNALYNVANWGRVTPYILGGLGGDIGYDSRLGLDLGIGIKFLVHRYFEPRFEVKNIYYGDTRGNDTVYQIVFTWPPVKDALEEAYQKTGKVEKMDMKINFDSGKTDVKEEYAVALQQYADFLVRHPDVKLSIKGYTDNVGTDADNKTLSQQRADSVAGVLVQTYGLSKDRIVTEGLGEADPVSTNDTDAGRAMNRRIEASTL
jgi:outer membrane protein OmpA-like peptidoglycan-associated protein